jgi:glycerophosphoryl diester phosphodiesterase
VVALPKVIGHRGAAASAPENTLESIRRANQLGARWVEFDAKLTADGVVILMHDETLERTTNGRGRVARTPYRTIAKLDAGRWFGAGFAGARVPRLDAALDLVAELGLAANIEIKPCPGRERETAAAIVRLVRRCWPARRGWPLLASFSIASLETARDLAPELPRGLLAWGNPELWRSQCGRLGCRSFHCSNRALPADLGAVRAAGLGLAVYTVNSRDEARRLLSRGVDCIITDRPDTVLPA